MAMDETSRQRGSRRGCLVLFPKILHPVTLKRIYLEVLKRMCQSYLEIKAPHDMRHERDVDRVERGDVGWGVLPDVCRPGAILREIGLTQARKSPRSERASKGAC